MVNAETGVAIGACQNTCIPMVLDHNSEDAIRRASQKSLLRFLLIQTYLDGGSTYATAYRDSYDETNAIAQLLKDGKCGAGKLLNFIESNEDCKRYLVISDRSRPPHLVSLTPVGMQYAQKYVEDAFRCSESTSTLNNQQLQHAASALQERLIYRLRQKNCKLRRRKANRCQQTYCSDEDDCGSPSGASLPWLIKKCPKELHLYVRLLPRRPMSILPFSKDWCGQVEPILHEFVRGRENIFVVGQRNGMVNVALVPHLQGEDDDGTNMDMEAIRTKLIGILRERGNPVGGLDVGNVLTDITMRSLLGGRDLTTVIRDNSVTFGESVEAYQDDYRNGAWYVRLCDSLINGGDNGGRAQLTSNRRKNLLWADEVGTYCLTDAQSALAMAKLLATVCNDDDSDGTLSLSAVSIDLTAGVGGNTIGLAKVFKRVIAYEIDSDRFEYLKRNIYERVDVAAVDIELRCEDSLAALDALVTKLDGTEGEICPVAVIIDPPFGGIHYRRQGCKKEGEGDVGDEGLVLGDKSLSKVVCQVMGSLGSCVVGLKLPMSFVVDRFVEKIRKMLESNTELRSYSLEVATVRKLARNLFVVIRLK